MNQYIENWVLEFVNGLNDQIGQDTLLSLMYTLKSFIEGRIDKEETLSLV